jgi:hypothetical protein
MLASQRSLEPASPNLINGTTQVDTPSPYPRTPVVPHLEEEVILEHSLHGHHQQIPQGEPAIVCSLRTFLEDQKTMVCGNQVEAGD